MHGIEVADRAAGLDTPRMARTVLLLCVAAGLFGCSDAQTWRNGEGQYCSTTNEDPRYVCSTASDLVCATTYSIEVTNPVEARKFDGGIRPVWLCRYVCDPGTACVQAQDVCCPAGAIHGTTYGKTHVCVPSSMCNTIRDGGARDTRGASDGGVARDGATDDAAAGDAPIATDGP
jgi:hypothetical protein